MKTNNLAANFKRLLALIFTVAFAICLCISTMPAKSASATIFDGDFVGYSGENNVSNTAMFSGSNTHNYYSTEQIFSDGFRKLYNMDAKNSNPVDSRKPLITVFTHGYGSRASHWSNNGSNTNSNAQFAYDSASAIERVSEKAGGANKYWAVCNGNSFKLINLNLKPTSLPYTKEGSITLNRITSTELSTYNNSF